MTREKRLLSIGECMVELAQIGPETYKRGFAGDTFNTAWYARRLLPADWQVAFGSVIGRDAVSDEMVAFMAGEGIEVDSLARHPTRSVGLYMISLDGGERSFSYWRSASAARTLTDDADWLAGILARAGHVHFSGITLAILGRDGRERLAAALNDARGDGLSVSFDTNLRPRLWKNESEMREGLRLGASVADLVLPSFDEETGLFGDPTPADTIRRYRDAGAEAVVVKDGAGPMHVWSAEEGAAEIAPPSVEQVVDTTAAGDSFAAGVWLENDGAIADQEAAAGLRGVPRAGRVAEVDLGTIRIVQVSGKTALAALDGCGGGDILIATVEVDNTRPCEVFGPLRLRETGALAIGTVDGQTRITTVAERAGTWLWTVPGQQPPGLLASLLERATGPGGRWVRTHPTGADLARPLDLAETGD